MQVKHLVKNMKIVLMLLVIAAALALGASSCERRCVCTYLDDGSQDIIYSAYSKKECQEWDTYYNETLNIRVNCEYKSY